MIHLADDPASQEQLVPVGQGLYGLRGVRRVQLVGLAERFHKPVNNDLLILFTNQVDADLSTVDDQYALGLRQVKGN